MSKDRVWANRVYDAISHHFGKKTARKFGLAILEAESCGRSLRTAWRAFQRLDNECHGYADVFTTCHGLAGVSDMFRRGGGHLDICDHQFFFIDGHLLTEVVESELWTEPLSPREVEEGNKNGASVAPRARVLAKVTSVIPSTGFEIDYWRMARDHSDVWLCVRSQHTGKSLSARGAISGVRTTDGAGQIAKVYFEFAGVGSGAWE